MQNNNSKNENNNLSPGNQRLILIGGVEVQLLMTSSEQICKKFRLTHPMWLTAFTTMCFMGQYFGVIFLGPIGDYLGRRMPIVLSYFGMMVARIIHFWITQDSWITPPTHTIALDTTGSLSDVKTPQVVQTTQE